MTDPSDSRRPVARRLLGLRTKLVLSHLAVIAVAMTLMGFGLLTLVRAYLLNALEDSLQAQAELITTSLLSESGVQVQPPVPDPAFNTLQQQQISNLALQMQNQPPGSDVGDFPLPNPESIQLTSQLPTHVLLIDSTGQSVFESGTPGPTGLQHSGAVTSALAGGTGRALLRGDAGDWMVLALPLTRQGAPIGALALAQPLQDLNAVLNDTLTRLVMAAGVAALLSALLGFLLAGRLVQPLTGLTEAAARLGEGDYDYPLSVRTQDEIGTLSSAFERMRRRLQQIERNRTQFISDVSHELRTPLTGIKGLVETLQDGALDDPEARLRFVVTIDHETDRLIRLTQDLLTLTRADEHALEMHLEHHDLGELVAATIDRLQPEAEKQAVRFDISRPGTALPVSIDPDRIEQVVLNLADNALKHSPRNAMIRIEIETVPALALNSLPAAKRESPITPSPEPASGTWAVVRVIDRGRGIPGEALPRVFDRFFRADPARDRQVGGSGLGLSIAMALIHEHGGRIWIESPSPAWDGEGQPGTQACFALPLI